MTARLRACRPPATTRGVAGGLLQVVRADRRTVWRWAIALLVAAAVVRVGWAAWIAHAEPDAVRPPDTPGYLEPARALLESARFSLSPEDSTPMYVRTPGYPAFLVPILWLTGSEWAISPIQAVVSLLAVVVTVLVGWRLIGKTAGLVAGVVVALDPLQFLSAGTIMTESLATIVLTAIVAIGAMVFALRPPSQVPPVALFALGVLAGVATMVRPTFWFYPVALLALLAIRFRGLGWRPLAIRLLAFLVPVVLVVGGWQLRNHATVGSWDVAGISDINLYCYNAAEVEATADGIDYDQARRRLGCPALFSDPYAASMCTRTEGYGCWMPDPDAAGQGFDAWGSDGISIMLDHPVWTAKMLAEGVAGQVAGSGQSKLTWYLGVDGSLPITFSLFAWAWVLWAFAAVGAVAGLRSRYRAFWLFLIVTIGYVILISTGKAGDARFRTPLVPLIALLAALGVRQCVQRFRRVAVTPPAVQRDDPVGAGRGLPF
jgi:4-amino-4-deoxy-L-arabinose transferase-like glycosyltransferase